jgi:hypothetical protein
MSAKAYEGGIRPYRLEFVRESTEGQWPDNPDFRLYSDNVRNFDPQITPGTEGQRGLGGVDFNDHFTGTGSFQFTVEYDLQQAIAAGSDASYDGIRRDSDNTLVNSHGVVRRMEQDSLDPDNTVNGTSSKDTRQFVVFKGAKIDTITITGDPTSPQPVMVQLDYIAEKAEVFQFDQPDANETLTVRSSSAQDTSQKASVAKADGSSENTVTLNGQTEVAVGSYSSYDGFQLDAETSGNVTLAVSGGDDLAVLRGQNAYDYNEGEQGVATLGTGSRGQSIGQDYEIVQGDKIERPDGTVLGDEVNSTEVTIENNVSEDATTSGPRPVVVANERLVSVDSTLFGETEYFDNMIDSLTATKNKFQWTLTHTIIEVLDSVVTEVGGTEEPTQGIKQVDATIEGEGINLA